MSEATNPQFEGVQKSLAEISARLAEDRRRRRQERRPASTLHVRPNLAHYRLQARRLHESRRASDSTLKLHAAQLEVARSVGFASWRKLAAAIHDRERAAAQLFEALRRGDHEAIARIVREYPHSLLDAGCVASPEELQLLMNIVLASGDQASIPTILLDSVAEHHKPEGLEECVRILLGLGADPLYANDAIEERRERVGRNPDGTEAAELFDNALGVLVWYVDEPEYDYLPEDD